MRRKLKLSNHTIKVIARRERKKERDRRKYGHPPSDAEKGFMELPPNADGPRKRRYLQKITKVKLNTAVEILKSGITPLGIMWEMMTGEREYDEDVMEICRAVAPYVHPKLSAVALQLGDGNETHEEALRRLDALPDGKAIIASALIAGHKQAMSSEDDEDLLLLGQEIEAPGNPGHTTEKEETSGDPNIDNQ